MRLLIGDCRFRRFKYSNTDDSTEAVAFLERSDVEVLNWYQKHGGTSEAHLKVWVAEGFPHPAVLIGSANLTDQGLYRNIEMVAEIAAAEVDEAVEQVESLFAKAWDAKTRLLEYIAPASWHGSSTSEKATPATTRGRDVGPVTRERETYSREPSPLPLLGGSGVAALWVVGALVAITLFVVLVRFLTRLVCSPAQWLCDAIWNSFSGG